jgi:hypothetical protein
MKQEEKGRKLRVLIKNGFKLSQYPEISTGKLGVKEYRPN